MEADAGEIAPDTIESSPQVRGLRMRIVQNHIVHVDTLDQARALRQPRRQPVPRAHFLATFLATLDSA